MQIMRKYRIVLQARWLNNLWSAHSLIPTDAEAISWDASEVATTEGGEEKEKEEEAAAATEVAATIATAQQRRATLFVELQ